MRTAKHTRAPPLEEQSTTVGESCWSCPRAPKAATTTPAEPGKTDEVETFLKQGQVLVDDEPQSLAWFAVRMDASRYGIFDVFEDDSGRDAPLTGAVAEALGTQAAELFAAPPTIHQRRAGEASSPAP